MSFRYCAPDAEARRAADAGLREAAGQLLQHLVWPKGRDPYLRQPEPWMKALWQTWPAGERVEQWFALYNLANGWWHDRPYVAEALRRLRTVSTGEMGEP